LAIVAGIFLEQINNAYRKETDVDVKERILLLVRRVRVEGHEASKIAERELHKSRWWAYKWLDRFDKQGIEGLKDQTKERVGIETPFTNPTKKMINIRQELSENPTGW
jgi:hypothetical protein